jgi:hypothetical protein
MGHAVVFCGVAQVSPGVHPALLDLNADLDKG